MKKLQWNVLIGDFNSKEIQTYNIFDHYRFKEDCDDIWKYFEGNRPVFESEIKKNLRYYFWSKCEWEVVIQHWPPSEHFRDKKIDVYDQVMMNWDIFIDYVWNTYSERRNSSKNET